MAAAELTNEQAQANAQANAQAAIRQYRSRWAYPTTKGGFRLPGTIHLQKTIEEAVGEHPGTDPYPLKVPR